MTLDDVRPYDPTRVEHLGDSAIVIGGGMAGLLAARVLIDAFESVTVLERDPLDAPLGPRNGTPQASHVHVMLEAGRAILETLEPGYQADVVGAGGLCIDAGSDLQYFHHGAYLQAPDTTLPMLCASRPLFEYVLRERVRDRDGITFRGECSFQTYVVDGTPPRVTGISYRDSNGESATMGADLVVDATGRASRTARWLDEVGYPRPDVEEVGIDLAYSSMMVERPPDTVDGFLVVPTSPNCRGGTVVPIEDERWVVTLFGLHGDHPPGDPAGFAEFARSLATAEPADILERHQSVNAGVHQYPFPANRRYRYDDLDAFPRGLLVTGDAIASFNPIYGQGMSVAALDALHLHIALTEPTLEDIADRYFPAVANTIDVIWRMTVGADFGYPDTTGSAPIGTRAFNWYLERLVKTAHRDGVATDAFARVLRLEHSPTRLLAPSLLWRVLAPP